MSIARRLAPLVLAASLALVSPASAQGVAPDSAIVYQLAGPPSEFAWGCFGPCACPVMIQATLAGTFALVRQPGTGAPSTFTTWDVREVRWKAAGANGNSLITGSGVYRRGGDAAPLEQLTLDLSFDGAPSQHFDSGLVPPGAPFPGIATRLSLHGEVCRDSVLVVDAAPLGVAGVEGASRAPQLGVAPNPFAGALRIVIALPADAVAGLAVYDVGGRRVRTLAARAALTRGAHAFTWDGRDAAGVPVPPGRYLVRLEGPAGEAARAVEKLR